MCMCVIKDCLNSILVAVMTVIDIMTPPLHLGDGEVIRPFHQQTINFVM